MTRFSRKFASLMLLLLSLTLLAGVGATWYFYEYKNRMNYFELLRFRQLTEAARGLDTNLAGFRTLATEHRKMIQSDLGGIYPVYQQVLEAANNLPEEREGDSKDNSGQAHTRAGKLDALLDAQARLLVFSPALCAQGEHAGLRLNARLNKRRGIESPEVEVSEQKKSRLNTLAEGMCYAGRLAAPEYRAEDRNRLTATINDLSRLLQDVTSDKRENSNAGRDGRGDYEFPVRILKKLLSSLKAFRLQLDRNGWAAIPATPEKLSVKVQALINAFWEKELYGPAGEYYPKEALQALRGADRREIIKSKLALEDIMGIVSNRYSAGNSIFAAELTRHRLDVRNESRSPLAASVCDQNSETGPLYIVPEKKGPYPASGFEIASCVWARDLAYLVSLASLVVLQDDENPFRLLIADANGDVVYAGGSGEQRLYYNNLSELIKPTAAAKAEATADGDHAKGKGNGVQEEASWKSAGVHQVSYAGIPHVAYVFPHKLSYPVETPCDLKAKGPCRIVVSDRFYFVGLVPAAEVRSQALRLTPALYTSLAVIGVAILLSFLFFKVRWSHLSAPFTRTDRYLVSSAVVVLALLIGVSWVTRLVSNQLSVDFHEDAVNALENIRTSFRSEFSGAFRTVDKMLLGDAVVPAMRGDTHGLQELRSAAECPQHCDDLLPGDERHIEHWTLWRDVESSSAMFGGVESEAFLCGDADYGDNTNFQAELHPVENLFLIDAKGDIAGELLRGTEYMVQSASKPNLSARQYFRQAKRGDVATWHVNAQQRYPFAIERIFSISNGSRTTQIAIPLKALCSDGTGSAGFQTLCDSQAKADADQSVKRNRHAPPVVALSFGLSFTGLMSPVIPSKLKYVVFDNATGRVLYHSLKSRVLVENFFEESEHNHKLMAYVDVMRKGEADSQKVQPPIDGVYRGKRSRFYVTQIDAELPWTLLVYHDLEYLQAYTALTFLLSFLFCFSLLLVVCVLLVFLRPLLPVDFFIWLWPQFDAVPAYRALTLSSWVVLTLAGMALWLLMTRLPWASENRLLVLSVITIVAVLGILLVFNRAYRLIQEKGLEHFGEVASDAAAESGEPNLSGAAYAGAPGWLSPRIETTRRVSFWYSMFVAALVFLLALIPSTLITYITGESLLASVANYDRMLLHESRQSQLQERGAYFARVYGEGQQQLASNIVYMVGCDGFSARSLASGMKQIRCPGIHSADGDGDPGPRRDRAITRLLGLISFAWRHAEIINALEANNGEHDGDAGRDTKDWPQEPAAPVFSYHYPSLGALIFGLPESRSATLFFLLLLTLVFFAVRFLALYLVGAMVPFSFHTAPQVLRLHPREWLRRNASATGIPCGGTGGGDQLAAHLSAAGPDDQAHHALLIRPCHPGLWFAGAAPQTPLRQPKVPVAQGTEVLPLDIQALTVDETSRHTLIDFATGYSYGARRLLLLANIESVAFSAAQRLALLEMLERIIFSEGSTSVVIFCDVSPLYMLTNQSQYQSIQAGDVQADAQEVVRWSRLLCHFRKYYDWNPELLQILGPKTADYYLVREISIWPDLYPLHQVVESQIGAERWQNLSEEQIVQFVGAHAASEYRRRWALCTRNERLLLFQLASGLMINPRNIEPLEHLMRRGYIVRNPRWSIANKSFARFILSAEDESVFSKWMEECNRGFWQFLKVPLLFIALTLLGIVIYSTQGGLEGFLALFTGVLTMIPLLMRNISLVKGAGETIPES